MDVIMKVISANAVKQNSAVTTAGQRGSYQTSRGTNENQSLTAIAAKYTGRFQE